MCEPQTMQQYPCQTVPSYKRCHADAVHLSPKFKKKSILGLTFKINFDKWQFPNDTWSKNAQNFVEYDLTYQDTLEVQLHRKIYECIIIIKP